MSYHLEVVKIIWLTRVNNIRILLLYYLHFTPSCVNKLETKMFVCLMFNLVIKEKSCYIHTIVIFTTLIKEKGLQND